MSDWTFYVIDNHPRMSRNYCELCGAEVDRKGNVLKSQEQDAKHGDMTLAIEAIRWAATWHLHEPQILTAIAIKLEHPEYSIRDLEKHTGLKKSRLAVILNKAIAMRPMLSAVLGMETPKARGQRQRRNKERKQGNEQDSQ